MFLATGLYGFIIKNPDREIIGSYSNENVQRLKITEDLVKQLLERVQILEIRDRTLQDRIQTLEMRDDNQQHQIQELQAQLATQKRRISALEKIIRRWHNPEFSSTDETADTDLDETGKEVESMRTMPNRIRRAENEVTVAFMATLSNHITHAGVNQIIIFDNVITNVGNAYNGHLGSFIAPVRGIYVFSVTLFAEQSFSFHASIVKNGQGVINMYLSSSEIGGYDTSSQTVIFQLNRGEDICILHRDPDRTIYGYSYTTFSGFLLQQDTSSQIVIGK